MTVLSLKHWRAHGSGAVRWVVCTERVGLTPLLGLFPAAHQQRAHPRGEEGVRVPLAGLHAGAEALQGAVHAGGAHAQTHRREAPQVHGEGLCHRAG